MTKQAKPAKPKTKASTPRLDKLEAEVKRLNERLDALEGKDNDLGQLIAKLRQHLPHLFL